MQHKVLGQIRSKHWFPRQPKALTDLKWGKKCPADSDLIFDWIFVKLAVNENSHTVSDEFNFGPGQTICTGVIRS